MQNPLSNANIMRIEKVSEQTVLFTISLNESPELRDAGIMQAAMQQYVDSYPNVSAWSAQAVGDWLFLTVAGIIDWSALEKFNG